MSGLIIPPDPHRVNKTSVRYGDLTPHIDVDQMREHLATLHAGSEGEFALCWTAPDQKFTHGWAPWQAMSDWYEDEPDFWRGWLIRGQHSWDMYTSVCTFTPHQRASWRTKENALQVPGVWADLDIKPGLEGHFHAEDELTEFIAQLPPMTMRVESGSGGVHGYWLLDPSKRLNNDRQAADLLEGWHEYLKVTANGRQVDKVQEVARVLRVAGTVRWTKPEDTGDLANVRWRRVQLTQSNGPRYQVEDLEQLVQPHLKALRERQRAAREAWHTGRATAISSLERRGLQSRVRAEIEGVFNATQDWQPLLEQAGWSLRSDNRDRSGSSACRYWVRPGKDPKSRGSASTDFNGSYVMTFFSPEVPQIQELVIPGLVDNHEGGTTKYRFALIALYDGDEGRLIQDIVNGKGRLSCDH